MASAPTPGPGLLGKKHAGNKTERGGLWGSLHGRRSHGERAKNSANKGRERGLGEGARGTECAHASFEYVRTMDGKTGLGVYVGRGKGMVAKVNRGWGSVTSLGGWQLVRGLAGATGYAKGSHEAA